MICVSIAFDALSYNFMSGSDEALAYDSLKMASKETVPSSKVKRCRNAKLEAK